MSVRINALVVCWTMNSCSWVVVTRKGRWRVGELAWAHLNIAFPTIRWWSVSWLGHTPLYRGFLSCCPQICVNMDWFLFSIAKEKKMHVKWKVGLGCCWPFHQSVDNNITSTFLDLGVKCEKYFSCFGYTGLYMLSGVHFSFDVLPSWADQGSCAHKCVC